MDTGEIITLVMVGLFVGLMIFILLLGWLYPGSGADVLDWKPTRSPEVEAENEVDDIEQMLAAANARRRRKGMEDLTEAGLTARVRADQRELAERRERDLLEGEIESVLEARNERRRKRGLPEMTLDELKASLGTPPPPGQR